MKNTNNVKNLGYAVSYVWDEYSYESVVAKNTTFEEYQTAMDYDGVNSFSRRDGFEYYFSETIEDAIVKTGTFPLAIDYFNLTDEEKQRVVDFAKEQIANGTIARNFPQLPADRYDDKAVEDFKKVLFNEGVYVYDIEKISEDLKKIPETVAERYSKKVLENENLFEGIKDFYKSVGVYKNDDETAKRIINVMRLKNECVSTIDVNNQQLNNSIAENEEIILDNEKVNVTLRLSDDKYEEFVNRTNLLSEKNITFKDALNNTDATFNIYVDFLPYERDTEMIICIESDELGWKEAKVPLTSLEKKTLGEDLNRVAKYHGTTVQKLFDEALGIEPDEPEKKIS